MSRIRIVYATALMLGAICFAEAPASAQPRRGDRHRPGPSARYMDVEVFYESLAPYGEWVQMPPYGWVWIPYDVSYDWRPYTNGYWIWTDAGWTWMSDEPFGWATYHYGRWNYSSYYGWYWVPGTQWGPAWVGWRRGNGFIGWAPLPVDSRPNSINIQIGNFGFEMNQIRNHAWSFIEERYLADQNIGYRIARPARNVSIIQNTQNITNYNVVNNTVVNNSYRREDYERRVKRPVTQYKIGDYDRPGNAQKPGGDNVIRFFKAKLDANAKRTPDVIFEKNKVTITPEMKKQQDAERDAVNKRLADEKKALMDRQQREAARVGKLGVTPEELKRQHEKEAKAFEEQETRSKRLVDRFYERVQKGQGGYTDSKNRNRFSDKH